MEVEPLVRHAHRCPPRCIADLGPEPLPQPLLGMAAHPFTAYFRIRCACGEQGLFILGHPRPGFFDGPLAIQCPRCEAITEMFDRARHGYDGEIGAAVKRPAEGGRAVFPCPRCGVSPMLVMPAFSYQADDIESWSEDIRRHPQDFFDDFSLYGGCVRCKSVMLITGFECA